MKTRSYIGLVGLILLSFTLPLPLRAQTATKPDVPKIIATGMAAYKVGGAEAALKTWLKGSPLEGSKDAMGQANTFRSFEDYYGAYKSYEVLRVTTVSENVRVVYLVMNFESGPLFGKYLVYKKDQEWILTNFDVSLKETDVFPSWIYLEVH